MEGDWFYRTNTSTVPETIITNRREDNEASLLNGHLAELDLRAVFSQDVESHSNVYALDVLVCSLT